ncbi:hypothetical protein TNCV_4185401 [Trichonephila clavipes]|nr:hypothetical protein TNCV_4185401 [Trichonephila clavipes]
MAFSLKTLISELEKNIVPGMLQENASNLSSYKRRLERLAGILKFQELLKMYPVPVKVVKNENGFHITDCVWTADQSDHPTLDILRVRAFARSEPKDVSSDYVEQEASKGAFIQALYAKSSLYRLAYKAWKRQGPQNLTTLAQAVDVMQRNGPIPCPRRMLHLSDALARKDTLWPWVSLAMFVATLGRE